MTAINRYSSRTESLDHFLPDLLQGATAYDRIAGYFRSTIFDLAGEAIKQMADGAVARIICNSDLQPEDVLTARAAQSAMLQEWKQHLPTTITTHFQRHLRILYDLLKSGRLQVKVLPQETFGLLHGKTGIITRLNGDRVSFVGSANETLSAWKNNYEIVWSDESTESADWVQAEFDALWYHKNAYDLADTVIEDIRRVSEREIEANLDRWREQEASIAAPQAIIETPIYTRENGLWAHQKWFIDHAFKRHIAYGARLLLADQVGLGKTIQLALTAKLMLLSGTGNVLVVVPKSLMEQWRDELWDMLALPSAIWTGKVWIDESGIEHPPTLQGHHGLRDCPRRLGIVSSGLIKQNEQVRKLLAERTWDCVIMDEAHHARRGNTGSSNRENEAQPNNLLTFLKMIAPNTRSMLLATATPIQLDPIEAYDLLAALNIGHNRILGADQYSAWQQQNLTGLEYIANEEQRPRDPDDIWRWMRAPFPDDLDVPPTWKPFERQRLHDLRKQLGKPYREVDYDQNALGKLSRRWRAAYNDLSDKYFDDLNPYISHIVRRRREFLETTIDPATKEYYLPRVEIELFGDGRKEAIHAPSELREAFALAEQFCREVGDRLKLSSGFLQTLLLRRVGSSLIAGQKTAANMLNQQIDEELADGSEEQDYSLLVDVEVEPPSKLHPLAPSERDLLKAFQAQLDRITEDPKYDVVLRLLRDGAAYWGEATEPWIDIGCIIFSQYYDSVEWLAERLQAEFPDHLVGIYAGAGRSGIWEGGQFERQGRDEIKKLVREGAIKLLLGTDAASEGLNLQRLGALINLDLPWNPTKLEQRKGRIQRIGQPRDRVFIFNMRYKDSVEDKVHEKLSARLMSINDMFGQLPDTLEDVWVSIARDKLDQAEQKIERLSAVHPFNEKYDRVESIDWESCSRVLESYTQLEALRQPWNNRKRG